MYERQAKKVFKARVLQLRWNLCNCLCWKRRWNQRDSNVSTALLRPRHEKVEVLWLADDSNMLTEKILAFEDARKRVIYWKNSTRLAKPRQNRWENYTSKTEKSFSIKSGTFTDGLLTSCKSVELWWTCSSVLEMTISRTLKLLQMTLVEILCCLLSFVTKRIFWSVSDSLHFCSRSSANCHSYLDTSWQQNLSLFHHVSVVKDRLGTLGRIRVFLRE